MDQLLSEMTGPKKLLEDFQNLSVRRGVDWEPGLELARGDSEGNRNCEGIRRQKSS